MQTIEYQSSAVCKLPDNKTLGYGFPELANLVLIPGKQEVINHLARISLGDGPWPVGRELGHSWDLS